jgi:hypothetical protein
MGAVALTPLGWKATGWVDPHPPANAAMPSGKTLISKALTGRFLAGEILIDKAPPGPRRIRYPPCQSLLHRPELYKDSLCGTALSPRW